MSNKIHWNVVSFQMNSFWLFVAILATFLALSATFWQSWLIFILHCGVLQIVECVTAEAFMKFFKVFYVLKICSYVFMLCNIEIPNIVVILIQQSFRHYPFISKNGNIIILKYADLNWFLAWLIKNKILNHFLNMQTFCRLVFFCRLVVASFEYADFFADLPFFLQTCFFNFADLLLQLLNMQTFFADFLQTFFSRFLDRFLSCQLPNHG